MRSSSIADTSRSQSKWRKALPFVSRKMYGFVKNSVNSLPDESSLKRTMLSANDRRIMSLRDIHKGRRGFILGNGPSLCVSDLDQLVDEVSFGSNKIYLAFDQTSWRPTYYSVTDILVAENNAEAIRRLQLDKIFASALKPMLKEHNDILWLSNYKMMRHGKPVYNFSRDLVSGIWGGFTVVYHQLQIAYYMGLTEVYILGMDFKFNVTGRTGQESMHGEVLEHEGKSNHFHPEYRKKGEKWTMPRLDIQKKAFECARAAFESAGRHIYNASRETELDVFPRVDFDDVIKSKGVGQ